MTVAIQEEPASALSEHAEISIAFQVDRMLDVTWDPGGRWVLRERLLDVPYVKDYDTIEGNRPSDWTPRFDVSSWGLLSAWEEGRRLGGVVVADASVILDIRVSPGMRGKGIGRQLFDAAEEWIAERGTRHLEVETQNINVAACRLYQNRGCRLVRVARLAYPELPDEIKLVWRKTLG